MSAQLRWWLLFAALVGVGVAASPCQADNFEFGEASFEAVGGVDDIPDQNVTVVAQDRQGFIWVGTPSGLFRYDGFRFRRADDSLAPGFPASAFIRSLIVGADGRIWVGTDADGLFALDPASGALEHFHNDAAEPASLINDSVSALAEDHSGAIWAGTRGGLDRLAPGQKRFEHFRDGSMAAAAGKDNRILALLVNRADDLWIGTWNGLNRKSHGSATIEHVDFSAQGPDALAGELVLSLYELRDGHIALGTARSGAYIVSADASQLTHLLPVGPDRSPGPAAEALGSASEAMHFAGEAIRGDPMVLAMIQPNDDELWLAGYGGIVVMSADGTRVIRYFRHDVSIASSLAHSQVRTLAQDDAGHIWVGGYGGGLQRHNPDNRGIRMLRHSPTRANALTSPNISAVMVLDDGQIWLGTRNNGIDIVDRRRGLIGGIRPNTGGLLKTALISSLAQTQDRSVWIGTLAGLLRIAPDTHAALAFQSPAALSDATMRKLVAARDGGLWIGSNIGLARWTPATNAIVVTSSIGGDVVSGDINAIVEADDGRLWVGFGAAGLYTLTTGATQLQRIDLSSASGKAIKLNVVGLLIDHQGRLWIDSAQGLARLVDWDGGGHGRIDEVGVRFGIGGRPMGANLLEDSTGRIWTQRFVYDPANGNLQELVALDGADLGTPWFRAYARTDDGLFLFGGSKGLMVADPANFSPSTKPIALRVTNVAIDGVSLPGWSAPQPLTLATGARAFSVEFAALDYSAPGRTRYEYQLGGYESIWNQRNAERRSADYANLPPGAYRLQVRAYNRDGLATANELDLAVVVAAAYWQTGWFRLGLVVLALLLTYGGFRLRTATIRARARELEGLVEHRTQELGVAKERAEKALEAMKGAQRQLVAAEKMASLGGLVAGVAHEINTPIGVGVTAASHLDDALQTLERELAAEQPQVDAVRQFSRLARQCTNMILRNLDRADKLIKSFKQVAVDQSTEQMRDVVVSTCLTDIVASLQPTLKRTPHRVSIDCPAGLEMTTYPGAIYQIVTNLIMNSLTHGFDAERAGDIRLTVRKHGAGPDGREMVQWVYADNGRGMTAHVREHVFDPFFTTRRGQGGTGLGMHIVFNLVTQALKGSVTCESTPGEGVRFEILLPVDVRA